MGTDLADALSPADQRDKARLTREVEALQKELTGATDKRVEVRVGVGSGDGLRSEKRRAGRGQKGGRRAESKEGRRGLGSGAGLEVACIALVPPRARPESAASSRPVADACGMRCAGFCVGQAEKQRNELQNELAMHLRQRQADLKRHLEELAQHEGADKVAELRRQLGDVERELATSAASLQSTARRRGHGRGAKERGRRRRRWRVRRRADGLTKWRCGAPTPPRPLPNPPTQPPTQPTPQPPTQP